MLEPSVWAVGNGASHSARIARTATFASTSGAEGIVNPSDFRVQATATPSSAVEVMPGAALLLNKFSGATAETYVGKGVSSTLVEIPASPSTGAQTHYICLTVSDAEFSGQVPEDPLTANYLNLEVLGSIPSNRPALPLARVVVPASTATITNAMITDLREVANPRTKDIVYNRPTVNADMQGEFTHVLRRKLNATGVRGEKFPDYGQEVMIDIPSWATRIDISGWLSGVIFDGPAYGAYWVSWGNDWNIPGQFVQDHGFSSSVAGKQTWNFAETKYIPVALRGTTVRFTILAGLDPSSPQNVRMDARSGVRIATRFIEEPDDLRGL